MGGGLLHDGDDVGGAALVVAVKAEPHHQVEHPDDLPVVIELYGVLKQIEELVVARELVEAARQLLVIPGEGEPAFLDGVVNEEDERLLDFPVLLQHGL